MRILNGFGQVAMNSAVLVVGELILDEYRVCSKQSASGLAKLYTGESIAYCPGGAANVAMNIAALGGTAYLCGAIGDDWQSSILLNEISFLVDTQYIEVCKGRQTVLKTRIHDCMDTEILKIDYNFQKPLEHKLLQKLLQHIRLLIGKVDGVIISDYGQEILQVELIQEIISLANEQGKDVFIDPRGKNMAKYRGCSYLTPTLKEFNVLSSQSFKRLEDAVPAAQSLLREKGMTAILLKNNARGSSLVTVDEASFCPVKIDQIASTVGAGDSMIAAFTLALLGGAGLQQAFLLSNLAASIAVSKPKTTTVSYEELCELVSTFVQKEGAI